MSSDFGARRRAAPKRSLKVWLVILMAASLMMAIVVGVIVRNREAKIATAREWAISGEPCPTLTPEAFRAGGFKAPQMFKYDAYAFGRRAGHVDCNAVGTKGGKGLGSVVICQFTSPIVLTVKTPRGEYVFNPGVGHAATVQVEDGAPRCVLASKFTVAG